MSNTGSRGSEARYMQAAQDQQERIRQAPADRDILVVAGAGSGKTRVMTDRIIKLINEDHIMPEKILGLTFTRKPRENCFPAFPRVCMKTCAAGVRRGGKTPTHCSCILKYIHMMRFSSR